jgi:hypothetical protein
VCGKLEVLLDGRACAGQAPILYGLRTMNGYDSERFERSRVRKKALWALVTASVTFIQLAAVSHLAITQHVICEHGELLELEGAPPVSAPESHAAAAQLECAMNEARGQAHHVHCAIHARLRDGVGRQSAPSISTFEWRLRPPPSTLVPPRSSLLVLRFAPKHSPPA